MNPGSVSSSRRGVEAAVPQMSGTSSSRVEILNWINSTCGTNIKRLEETSNGVIACFIVDKIHPNVIPMKRLNYNANDEYENSKNYKLLQAGFNKLNITKNIDMEKLAKGRPQETIEFMQWLFTYYSTMTGENELDSLNPLIVGSSSVPAEPVGATPRSRTSVPRSTPRTGSALSTSVTRQVSSGSTPRSVSAAMGSRPKLGVPVRAIGANRGAGLVEEENMDEDAEEEPVSQGSPFKPRISPVISSRASPVVVKADSHLSTSIKQKPILPPTASAPPRPPIGGSSPSSASSKSWSSLRGAVKGMDQSAPLPSAGPRAAPQASLASNSSVLKELNELREEVKKLRTENQSINTELQSLYNSYNGLAEKHHSLQEDHELSNKDVDFYYNKLVAVESAVKTMVVNGESHPILEQILTIMYKPEEESNAESVNEPTGL